MDRFANVTLPSHTTLYNPSSPPSSPTSSIYGSYDLTSIASQSYVGTLVNEGSNPQRSSSRNNKYNNNSSSSSSSNNNSNKNNSASSPMSNSASSEIRDDHTPTGGTLLWGAYNVAGVYENGIDGDDVGKAFVSSEASILVVSFVCVMLWFPLLIRPPNNPPSPLYRSYTLIGLTTSTLPLLLLPVTIHKLSLSNLTNFKLGVISGLHLLLGLQSGLNGMTSSYMMPSTPVCQLRTILSTITSLLLLLSTFILMSRDESVVKFMKRNGRKGVEGLAEGVFRDEVEGEEEEDDNRRRRNGSSGRKGGGGGGGSSGASALSNSPPPPQQQQQQQQQQQPPRRSSPRSSPTALEMQDMISSLHATISEPRPKLLSISTSLSSVLGGAKNDKASFKDNASFKNIRTAQL